MIYKQFVRLLCGIIISFWFVFVWRPIHGNRVPQPPPHVVAKHHGHKAKNVWRWLLYAVVLLDFWEIHNLKTTLDWSCSESHWLQDRNKINKQVWVQTPRESLRLKDGRFWFGVRTRNGGDAWCSKSCFRCSASRCLISISCHYDFLFSEWSSSLFAFWIHHLGLQFGCNHCCSWGWAYGSCSTCSTKGNRGHDRLGWFVEPSLVFVPLLELGRGRQSSSAPAAFPGPAVLHRDFDAIIFWGNCAIVFLRMFQIS